MVSLAPFRHPIASLQARCLALLVMDEPWSAAESHPPHSRRRYTASTSTPRKPVTVRPHADRVRAGAPHG